MTASPLTPSLTATRQVWRRRVAWLLALVALVASGACALWLLIPRTASAHNTARELFEALADGDAERVAATGVHVADDTRDFFVDAQAYLSSPVIRSSEESDAAAAVTVEYTLADRPQTMTLHLRRSADGWVPASEDVLTVVTAHGDIGAGMTGGDAFVAWDTDVMLLPAVYELRAAPYAVVEGQATLAATGGTERVAVPAAFRSGAQALAQEQLDAYLIDCTRRAATIPEMCGIRIPWAADLAEAHEFRYRIDALPQITVTADSFSATDGTLVATVSGIDHRGRAREVTYRSTAWGVRGTLSFTADALTLQVW